MKLKSTSICNIITKSQLRSQQLNVFIYHKRLTGPQRCLSHGWLQNKPIQTKLLPSSLCSCPVGLCKDWNTLPGTEGTPTPLRDIALLDQIRGKVKSRP